MQCPQCEKDLPEHLLQPLMVNGAHTEPMCPICALGIINKTHGINRKEFAGTQAQEMLREAKKHVRSTGQ